MADDGEPEPEDAVGDDAAVGDPDPVAGPLGGADEGDPFEQMTVPDIDEETVWEELSAGGPALRAPDTGDDAAALDDLTARLDVDADRREAVVPKNQFCERCVHFADPPAVACGHEGTEIEELVDVEHFRVVDCPVVASRRSLGYEE